MMKAQAAIFDGIIFLLLSTFSASLIYVSVANYGQQEDAVMRSAHVMNYMQSFMKSIYFVNAQTLAGVCQGDACAAPWYQDLADPEKGCKSLETYLGSISVTDLLKRDLADPETMLLDNKYGGIPARGKTATRCAAKELMKPFADAGYKYYVEVVNPQSTILYENGDPVPLEKGGKKMTNSNDPRVIKEGDENYERLSGCEEAVKAGYKVLSISAPFRVTPAKAEGSTEQGGGEEKHLVFRVCIWPSSEAAQG